ncbi:MAG: substrate-binding domain-containing protein [Acidobacteriaceae bacterium]|nr:substrate-binding domain-containing protein [Acidobacteriaceae bacterium]
MCRRHTFPFAFTVSVVLLTLVSCAPLPHDPKETYTLITANTNLPYWQAAVSGLNHAAAEMRVRAEVDGPEAYDPKAEYDAFQKAVQRKPSGILLWAVDADLMTPGINAAVSQGIPVVTVNADAPNSERLLFVGTDNYRGGELAGHLAAGLLKGKGSVAVFNTPAPVPARDRLQGFQDAIAKQAGMKIAEVIDVKGDPTVAFDAAKRFIDTKSGIAAFVCFSATAGPEVGEVVNRANMGGKLPVIAMDADPRTLDLIRKGAITTTIAQKPYTMAYVATKLLDDLHHHPPNPLNGNWAKNASSPVPAFVDSGTFVIDKNNVDAAAREQTSKAE